MSRPVGEFFGEVQSEHLSESGSRGGQQSNSRAAINTNSEGESHSVGEKCDKNKGESSPIGEKEENKQQQQPVEWKELLHTNGPRVTQKKPYKEVSVGQARERVNQLGKIFTADSINEPEPKFVDAGQFSDDALVDIIDKLKKLRKESGRHSRVNQESHKALLMLFGHQDARKKFLKENQKREKDEDNEPPPPTSGSDDGEIPPKPPAIPAEVPKPEPPKPEPAQEKPDKKLNRPLHELETLYYVSDIDRRLRINWIFFKFWGVVALLFFVFTFGTLHFRGNLERNMYCSYAYGTDKCEIDDDFYSWLRRVDLSWLGMPEVDMAYWFPELHSEYNYYFYSYWEDKPTPFKINWFNITGYEYELYNYVGIFSFKMGEYIWFVKYIFEVNNIPIWVLYLFMCACFYFYCLRLKLYYHFVETEDRIHTKPLLLGGMRLLLDPLIYYPKMYILKPTGVSQYQEVHETDERADMLAQQTIKYNDARLRTAELIDVFPEVRFRPKAEDCWIPLPNFLLNAFFYLLSFVVPNIPLCHVRKRRITVSLELLSQYYVIQAASMYDKLEDVRSRVDRLANSVHTVNVSRDLGLRGVNVHLDTKECAMFMILRAWYIHRSPGEVHF